MALVKTFLTIALSESSLKSRLEILIARFSHSRLLKLKTMTGLNFFLMVILMIL